MPLENAPTAVEEERLSASIAAERSWNPEIVKRVYDLVDRIDLKSQDPTPELGLLASTYGDAVYAELIYLLSHLRFDDAEARQHWSSIVALRDEWRKRLESDVDLRVALVSYFVQVHRKLKNPKIIEMKLFERTQDFAYRDELTGLHNYRMFREYLAQEVLRSERCETPLSLIMLDVDDFKTYNDRNGHEAGNALLAALAGLMNEALRKGDVGARYGGEEFAIILPSTTKLAAMDIADRLRAAVEQHAFPHRESQPGGRLTVSIGIATCPADASDTVQLVRQADRALYAAKAQGKNQVQLYGQSRRSFTRFEVNLAGNYHGLVPGTHPLTTVNVSQGGLLAVVDQTIEAGSLIDIRLQLPDSDHEIRTAGRVVHATETEGGKCQAAIRILDMDPADQDRLRLCLRRAGTDG